MCPFVGGSAPAMARQVVEGYTLVNAVSLKRLTDQELELLQFELDRKLREIRGEQPEMTDTQAIQFRNRRMSRLDGALRVLRNTVQERRRR
jgi:23S rRNA maturation-related 3'-5' exoribonuclease YhaM